MARDTASGYAATAGWVSKIRVAPVAKSGHPGSPSRANRSEAVRIWADTAYASLGRFTDEQGGLPGREIAEDERDVQAVARAEDAAHAGRGPGPALYRWQRPPALHLCLGEFERGHPEEPVGAHDVEALLRVGEMPRAYAAGSGAKHARFRPPPRG